jgi:hypothetical protein
LRNKESEISAEARVQHENGVPVQVVVVGVRDDHSVEIGRQVVDTAGGAAVAFGSNGLRGGGAVGEHWVGEHRHAVHPHEDRRVAQPRDGRRVGRRRSGREVRFQNGEKAVEFCARREVSGAPETQEIARERGRLPGEGPRVVELSVRRSQGVTDVKTADNGLAFDDNERRQRLGLRRERRQRRHFGRRLRGGGARRRVSAFRVEGVFVLKGWEGRAVSGGEKAADIPFPTNTRLKSD